MGCLAKKKRETRLKKKNKKKKEEKRKSQKQLSERTVHRSDQENADFRWEENDKETMLCIF